MIPETNEGIHTAFKLIGILHSEQQAGKPWRLFHFFVAHRHFIEALDDHIKFGIVTFRNKNAGHGRKQGSLRRRFRKFVREFISFWFIQ